MPRGRGYSGRSRRRRRGRRSRGRRVRHSMRRGIRVGFRM